MSQDRTALFGAREGNEGIVRCDACPVLCRIRPGRAGACSRYANQDGALVRTDPLVLMTRTREAGGETVPFHIGKKEAIPIGIQRLEGIKIAAHDVKRHGKRLEPYTRIFRHIMLKRLLLYSLRSFEIVQHGGHITE